MNKNNESNRLKMESQIKFNKRSFVASGMLLSFLGLPVSGLLNHSLGFDTLSIERHLWMSIHNILGTLFLFFSIWHIILNRKPLKNYLQKAAKVVLSRELIVAAIVIVLLLTFAIFHVLVASGRV